MKHIYGKQSFCSFDLLLYRLALELKDSKNFYIFRATKVYPDLQKSFTATQIEKVWTFYNFLKSPKQTNFSYLPEKLLGKRCKEVFLFPPPLLNRDKILPFLFKRYAILPLFRLDDYTLNTRDKGQWLWASRRSNLIHNNVDTATGWRKK